MWFDENDINKKEENIVLDNLHGYVLPHAGTKYTGNILSHSLQFQPSKKFENILIIYLPANKRPNVGEYHHEYYVLLKVLKMYFPEKNFIGYNLLSENRMKIRSLTKKNTLYVVSADFSHFLDLQDAILQENCAAHSLMHKNYSNKCVDVIDDIRSFKELYRLLPNIVLQWIGRTRSPGLKGVGYLSFLLRDKPRVNKKPNGFFVTAYDNKMRQRECLGNRDNWDRESEKKLIKEVIDKAKITSRLTNGNFLDSPISNYTVTYLYEDLSKKFIRGWHAISKNALYLPDVFLENTYDNGDWIKDYEKEWKTGKNFDIKETISMLDNKANRRGINNENIKLFRTEEKHVKIKLKGGVTYKKRKKN